MVVIFILAFPRLPYDLVVAQIRKLDFLLHTKQMIILNGGMIYVNLSCFMLTRYLGVKKIVN